MFKKYKKAGLIIFCLWTLYCIFSLKSMIHQLGIFNSLLMYVLGLIVWIILVFPILFLWNRIKQRKEYRRNHPYINPRTFVEPTSGIIKKISCNLYGVTYPCKVGYKHRQSIIAKCHVGDSLIIKKYTYNGSPAYIVFPKFNTSHDIGVLSQELSDKIHISYPENKKIAVINSFTDFVSSRDNEEYIGLNITIYILDEINSMYDTDYFN